MQSTMEENNNYSKICKRKSSTEAQLRETTYKEAKIKLSEDKGC